MTLAILKSRKLAINLSNISVLSCILTPHPLVFFIHNMKTFLIIKGQPEYHESKRWIIFFLSSSHTIEKDWVSQNLFSALLLLLKAIENQELEWNGEWQSAETQFWIGSWTIKCWSLLGKEQFSLPTRVSVMCKSSGEDFLWKVDSQRANKRVKVVRL